MVQLDITAVSLVGGSSFDWIGYVLRELPLARAVPRRQVVRYQIFPVATPCHALSPQNARSQHPVVPITFLQAPKLVWVKSTDGGQTLHCRRRKAHRVSNQRLPRSVMTSTLAG